MNGSIRQRTPGTWELCIYLGRDEDGRQRRKYVTFRGTKGAAQRRLRQLLTDMDKGVDIGQAKVLLKDWMRRWMAERIIPSCKQLTIEDYQSIIDKRIVPALGHIDIAKLTPADVQAFYADQAGELAPKTRWKVHAILSGALKHAHRTQLIYRNPASLVPPRTPEAQEIVPPDASTVRSVIEVARLHKDPLYPAIHVAAYTGMRRGEVIGLTWDKVDLVEGRILVDLSVVKTRRKGVMATSPKTKAGRRIIDLDPETMDVLSYQWDVQQEMKRAMGAAFKDRGRVFTTPEGDWVRPDKLRDTLKKYGAKVGAPELTVRSLRHFHASLALQSGHNVVVVSRRLGHSKVSTTTDIYAHSLPGWQKELAQDFARLMEG